MIQYHDGSSYRHRYPQARTTHSHRRLRRVMSSADLEAIANELREDGTAPGLHTGNGEGLCGCSSS